MGQYYGAESVKCPFYSEETKDTIKCEGDFSVFNIHIFESGKSKLKHKTQFCDKFNYKKCSYYKTVMLKYDLTTESGEKT